MVNIPELKKLLAEEYGIRSEAELSEALRKMKKVNIGVFVTPVRKEDKNGKECIA